MYVEDFEEDFNRETGERLEPGRDEPPKGAPVEPVQPEEGKEGAKPAEGEGGPTTR